VFLIKEALAAHNLDVDLQVIDDGEQANRFIAGMDEDDSAPCPRLILLDLNLPKAGGLEVLACVRRSTRCTSVPVLIMTSSDADRDRADVAALGATAYFRKPVGYEAFLAIGEVIHQLLA